MNDEQQLNRELLSIAVINQMRLAKAVTALLSDEPPNQEERNAHRKAIASSMLATAGVIDKESPGRGDSMLRQWYLSNNSEESQPTT